MLLMTEVKRNVLAGYILTEMLFCKIIISISKLGSCSIFDNYRFVHVSMMMMMMMMMVLIHCSFQCSKKKKDPFVLKLHQ